MWSLTLCFLLQFPRYSRAARSSSRNMAWWTACTASLESPPTSRNYGKTRTHTLSRTQICQCYPLNMGLPHRAFIDLISSVYQPPTSENLFCSAQKPSVDIEGKGIFITSWTLTTRCHCTQSISVHVQWIQLSSHEVRGGTQLPKIIHVCHTSHKNSIKDYWHCKQKNPIIFSFACDMWIYLCVGTVGIPRQQCVWVHACGNPSSTYWLAITCRKRWAQTVLFPSHFCTVCFVLCNSPSNWHFHSANREPRCQLTL